MKRRRSSRIEELKGEEKQKGESQIEYDRRIIREYIYKQTKYDLSEIYRLTATDTEKHEQLARKLDTVEGLFNNKQIVFKGIQSSDKEEVTFMLKVRSICYWY